MRYLFWNTNKNENINPILCDLIIENEISIVVIAEYAANITNLINLLDNHGISMRQAVTAGCEFIHILVTNNIQIEPQLQTDRSSIQVINDNIILCSLHLNSRIYANHDDKREIEIEKIIEDILYTEKIRGTKNTIIVGDFNLNPYDTSCLSARYFHGIPIYEDTKKESRIVAGKVFHMFYNPMWNFLGDFKEPYGTYYYNSSDTVNSYWNVYDQVIIRPALRKRFIEGNLKILTHTTKVSLLDVNKHPKKHFSDHLPITFEVKEEEHE